MCKLWPEPRLRWSALGTACRPALRTRPGFCGQWAAGLCFPFHELHQHILSPSLPLLGGRGCRVRHFVFCMFPREAVGEVLPFFQLKKKKFSKYANFQDTVAIKEADVSHEKAPDSREQGHEEPNPANLPLSPQLKEPRQPGPRPRKNQTGWGHRKSGVAAPIPAAQGAPNLKPNSSPAAPHTGSKESHHHQDFICLVTRFCQRLNQTLNHSIRLTWKDTPSSLFLAARLSGITSKHTPPPRPSSQPCHFGLAKKFIHVPSSFEKPKELPENS